jgi:hypothetical protein
MAYNLAAIRELISAAFNDEELTTFCSDHFRGVYENFAAGQTRAGRAQQLIDFAKRNGQLDTLLDEIAKANPYQFGLFADKVGAEPVSQFAGLTPDQAAGGEQGGPRIGSIDLRGSQGAVISPSGPVTQTFGPMIDTGGGAYVGGNVATGGGDFVWRDRISKTSGGATPEQFAALLAELRAALAQAKLDAEERDIAEGDLAVIETQAGKPQPKLSVIEGKLSSIKTLIEGAAGAGVAATGLAQVVQRGIELAQQLFR